MLGAHVFGTRGELDQCIVKNKVTTFCGPGLSFVRKYYVAGDSCLMSPTPAQVTHKYLCRISYIIFTFRTNF
jgi:hypothetical protein